jgi:type IV pilus assembly protein PilQ
MLRESNRTAEEVNFMFARFCLTAAVAVALALSPSVARAQAGQRVTMEWQSAPLNDVVQAFAKFSGRTIAVAPDVGNPEMTASVQNVEWQRALAIVLATRGLVTHIDASGVIRIEKQAAPKS